MAVFKKKINSKILLDELNKFPRLESGEIEQVTTEIVDALVTLIEFNDYILDLEKFSIVKSAIFEINTEFTEKTITSKINKYEKQYSQRQAIPYEIRTTISIFEPVRKSIQYKGMRIQIGGKIPDTVASSKRNLTKRMCADTYQIDPPKYSNVTILVNEQSYQRAYEQSQRFISLFRGALNLQINSDKISQPQFAGEAVIANEIRMGPIHTINRPNGVVISDLIGYESEYIEVTQKKYSRSDYTRMINKAADILRTIENTEFGRQIEDGIIRFNDAMDSRNHHVALTKLWGLLEYLTDCMKLKYDTLIERLAAIYRNKEYKYLILLHIKENRNRYIHADFHNMRIDAILSQAQIFTKDLLYFYLKNIRQFENLQEASAFLDYAYKSSSLDKKMKLLKKAIKFTESQKDINRENR